MPKIFGIPFRSHRRTGTGHALLSEKKRLVEWCDTDHDNNVMASCGANFATKHKSQRSQKLRSSDELNSVVVTLRLLYSVLVTLRTLSGQPLWRVARVMVDSGTVVSWWSVRIEEVHVCLDVQSNVMLPQQVLATVGATLCSDQANTCAADQDVGFTVNCQIAFLSKYTHPEVLRRRT